MAVAQRRVRWQDVEDELSNGRLLAWQLAGRHVGTDEMYKHYLAKTLNKRLHWDKTHATDGMDWCVEEPKTIPINRPAPLRAYAAVPPPEDLISTLPPRQQVIARLVAEGKDMDQIARRLGRTPSQIPQLRGEMTKMAHALTKQLTANNN
jgi:DNA-binding CsgD family transcriptional regulator